MTECRVGFVLEGMTNGNMANLAVNVTPARADPLQTKASPPRLMLDSTRARIPPYGDDCAIHNQQ